MTRNEDPDRDFGRILEDFESRHSPQKPKGKLIRQDQQQTPPPRQYQKPTEEEDFGAALAAFDAEKGVAKPIRQGERVEGTILTLNLESALVDLGAKAEGVVDTDLLTDDDGILLYKTGDSLTFEVLGPDPSGARRLQPAGGVLGAAVHLESGDIVEGEITGINKGGAEVKLKGGRRAFCPFSQLADHRVEDAEAMVGQKHRFLVKQAGDRDVVLSRRALLEKEKAERVAVRRAELSVGAVVKGRVSAIEDYGVFVDLGELEGLVHVSELSHRRVENPRDEVKVGQELEVKITRLERRPDGRDRISLSRKALERDPWLDANQRFGVGSSFEGRVRRLESFGAFVELEPGVEGLLHISELGSGRRLNHPREVLEVGQELAVRVLNLDVTKKRISLTAIDRGEIDANEPSVRDLLEEHRGSGSGFGTLAAALNKKKSH